MTPVWIGDGCRMVDAGALSQPNRSLGGSAPSDPAAAAPPATSQIACRCGVTLAGSRSGAIGGQASGVQADPRRQEIALTAEQDHARVDALTAGQIGHDADDDVLEGGHGRSGTRR